MLHLLRRLWSPAPSAICLASLSLAGVLSTPRPVSAADTIRIAVGGPLVLSIDVDDLETFAQTGEPTGDFAVVARLLDDALLTSFQQGLRRPIPFDLQTVDTLAYSPLGRDAIFNVGHVIRVHPEVNGFHGLRAAVIAAAANADAEGWTLLDILRQFPSDSIDINLGDVLELRQVLSVYFGYTEAVVSAIQAQADADAFASTVNPAALADLSQLGPYGVYRDRLTVQNPALRQTEAGLTVNYAIAADIYAPDGAPGGSPNGSDRPAPVVIFSHGFGDVQDSFTFMAEHLASHGIAVILPNHVGSNLSYRQGFLEGRLNTLLSPVEFLNRPQEISFLLDELERRVAQSPAWGDRIDLDRIGVMGDSMGGTTVLALAGAEINYARLAHACDADNIILNFALYLQCRARFLPPRNYQLRDERIRAVLAMHPLGGYLYGPEGMGQIDIPLLMIAGSNDIVSPVVPEQIHPFIWTQSQEKYLALLQEGTHFTAKPGREGADGLFGVLAGDHRDIGTRYGKILATAFWQVYLNDDPAYLPYLTARYGQALSQNQPLRVDIVQALTPRQLERAYGRTPPIPVIPPAIAPVPPPRDEQIMAEIARTGVLKVGFRKDAPPFGYVTETNEWDGYCGDMAIALAQSLRNTLSTPVTIELVEFTSTLQNRFDLVRDGVVHLECGPNTIRPDVEGIDFSRAVFAASARFVVPRDATEPVNPNLPLADVRLGVLPDTTTERFLETTYPDATIIPFVGSNGRRDGLQAVQSGDIDAFVGDDVLSYAEIQLIGMEPSDVAFVPDIPLTCEFYGFALPDDDPEWKATVDAFVASNGEDEVFKQWFEPFFPLVLDISEFCLNRL